MKISSRLLVISLFTVLSLFSCSHQKEKHIIKNNIKENLSIKYAKGFDIQYFKNFTKLIVKSPYPNSDITYTYTLSTNNVTKVSKNNQTVIKVPINKIVVNSTTHIPMLELLQVQNSLVGFPNTNYISSEETRKLVDKGSIKDIGSKGAINTEILIALKPDAVIGFSMSKENKSLNLIEKSGIPVLLNGDWLEETPLGRAEWIKFFGVLYNKEKEADSIFNNIEKNYLDAVAIAKKATEQPTILSGAVMSKDIWNLPAGESFVATFLKDANTKYLWRDSKGKGSLSISFESVLDKGKEADYWISPGYFTNKEQMIGSNKHYQEFTALKKDQVFVFSNKKGATSGVLYYELGPTRPDLVLKDIIRITHPTLLTDYTPTFFSKMN